MNPPVPLQPLDFLLYRPASLFGYAIRFHTGHNISHVEVYIGRTALARVAPLLLKELDAKHGAGTDYVTASRDGKGVDFYPVRIDKTLAYVMRPEQPRNDWQIAQAAITARSFRGTPYGWLDLISFFGFNVNHEGIVCSPYATLIGRAAGIELFNSVQPRLVAPYLFRASESLSAAWTDGKDAAIDAAGV